MTSESATVFLVDDDARVRKALARLLQSAGREVASFASAEDFLERYDPAVPGCLVLDLAMPGLDGLALQSRLAAAAGSPPPIIFLTGHGDIPASVRAMKAGAVDFLIKPVRDSVLLGLIEVALDKDRRARRERAELAALRERIAALTPREREVLGLVVQGKLNKQIAYELGTVEKTIKVHRSRLMQKMKVASVAELVRIAERAGLGASSAGGDGAVRPAGPASRTSDVAR